MSPALEVPPRFHDARSAWLQKYMESLLAAARGNVCEAARISGLSRGSVYHFARIAGVRPDAFR